MLTALGIAQAGAAPIAYNEISLLVRMRESNAYIVQQVRTRSLLRPLTPQQEATLAAQGAPEQLLSALRDPKVVLSDAEATAFEAQAEREKAAIQQSIAKDEADARQRARDLARAAAEAPPAYQEPPSSQADLLPSYYGDDGDLFAIPGGGRFPRGSNLVHRSSNRPGASAGASHINGITHSGLNGPGSFTATTPTAISSNAVFTPGHR